jgi:photosystem II stability/assembly factor-like uncharacterized protein
LSTIGHSIDGGDSWVESSGPTRSVIQDAHFFSRNVGFAVGSKGTVLRTIDGGTNWIDLSKGDAKTYNAIHGLTTNDLWIGTNQRVLHSTDMGDTWTEKLYISGGLMNDVLAISTTRILACSSTGIIYRTTKLAPVGILYIRLPVSFDQFPVSMTSAIWPPVTTA